MKKILLFVSACLFAFAANAQTTVNLDKLIGTFSFSAAWDNGGAQVWYGDGSEDEPFDASDFSTLYLEYSDVDVDNGLLRIAIEYTDADKQEIEISDASGVISVKMTGKSIKQIYLMAAAGNYVQNPETQAWEATTFLTTATVSKAYLTSKSEEGGEQDIIDPIHTENCENITLSKNNADNYQSKEIEIALNAPIRKGDIVSVSLKGKISEAVDGLKAVLIECAEINNWSWNVLSEYKEISGTLAKGDEVNASFDLTATGVSEGNVIRLYFMTSNKPVDGISSITIGDGENTNPEPEIVATFTQAIPTLEFTAEYDKEDAEKITGYMAKVALNLGDISLKTDDYVALSFDGSFDQDVLGVSPAIIDQCEATNYWGEMSEWEWTQMDAKANAAVKILAYVKITKDAQSENIIASIPLQSPCGAESIVFKSNVASAVEDVAKLAVEGGFVYSAGEIVVYNIAGKIVATASQAFNVNSLDKGVYFISAPEGVIKYMK